MSQLWVYDNNKNGDITKEVGESQPNECQGLGMIWVLFPLVRNSHRGHWCINNEGCRNSNDRLHAARVTQGEQQQYSRNMALTLAEEKNKQRIN